jgi:hypothetical protein
MAIAMILLLPGLLLFRLGTAKAREASC